VLTPAADHPAWHSAGPGDFWHVDAVLILSGADIERVLDLDRLVDAVGEALADLSAGRASMPPRVAAAVPDRSGLLVAMPAHVPALGALTAKILSVFPENRKQPSHQALICVFDVDSGTPIALLDGTYITATRTAAGSLLATRLLARPDARVVAVIGTGVQARSHLRAFARGWRVDRFVIAGRTREQAEALAGEIAGELGVDVEPADSAESAVRAADIVCGASHAAEPVVRRPWLAAGAHVNSVGYNLEGTGEVDADTVRDARVVVESRAATLAPPPAGAVELQGAVAHAELGELVAGTATGRTAPDEITLYKSVGVAVEDSAAAVLALEGARAAGVGREFES
jgi:ornithine cyclodeaminase/alanine dehydrogenase-like protein (mu-crystallin family)